MCDIATIGIAMTVASTAMSVVGGIQQAGAQRARGRYQRQIAQNNAIVAQRQAAAAIQIGEQQAAVQQFEARALAGRQRAAFAANGVVVDDGTAINVVEGTLDRGVTNAQIARANAQRQALGFSTQAQNFLQQGFLSEVTGRQQSQASLITAGSDAVSGAGIVANKWRSYQIEDPANKDFALGRLFD